MRFAVLLIVLAVGLCGCHGPGRPAAIEHLFPLAHEHTGHGVNTRSRPPCPYFDPPPKGGAYEFCENCGVIHATQP